MAPLSTCSCGECHKCKRREYMKAWYRSPGRAEKVRARTLRYRAENIEKVREYDRKRGSRTPKEKNDAHNIVRHALEQGLLQRGPCEVCGQKPEIVRGYEIIHGHHDDYSKPLDVRWLCREHHSIEHRRIP